MKTQILFAVLSIMLLIAVPGVALDDLGKQVYLKKCATCHGADGVAKESVEKTMKVTMKPLGSKEVLAKTEARLKKDTVEGIGKMKAVKGMTDAEVDAVIKFMRTLGKK